MLRMEGGGTYPSNQEREEEQHSTLEISPGGTVSAGLLSLFTTLASSLSSGWRGAFDLDSVWNHSIRALKIKGTIVGVRGRWGIGSGDVDFSLSPQCWAWKLRHRRGACGLRRELAEALAVSIHDFANSNVDAGRNDENNPMQNISKSLIVYTRLKGERRVCITCAHHVAKSGAGAKTKTSKMKRDAIAERRVR